VVIAATSRFLATCVAAVPFFVAPASYAQTERLPRSADPVPERAQQHPAPVDPGTLSCAALKGKLQAAGELTILSGPNGGWGDTFHGPAVPRCEFWQMPVFTYVKTSDGLCGVGYICVEKMSFD